MIHTEHDLWSKYVQYSTGGVMACNGSTVQGWDVRFDNYILLSDSALSPELTLIGTQGATLSLANTNRLRFWAAGPWLWTGDSRDINGSWCIRHASTSQGSPAHNAPWSHLNHVTCHHNDHTQIDNFFRHCSIIQYTVQATHWMIAGKSSKYLQTESHWE